MYYISMVELLYEKVDVKNDLLCFCFFLLDYKYFGDKENKDYVFFVFYYL